MRRFWTLAQLAALAFWLATACYALLAAQTFVYEQFLRPQLSPAVAGFARYHLALAIGLLLLYAIAHVRTPAAGRCHRLAVAVAVCVWGLTVLRLFFVPLAAVGPGPGAHLCIAAALSMMVLVAAADIASAPPIGTAPPSGSRHASDLVACLGSAAVATAVSAGIGFARAASLTTSSFTGVVTSALLHLVVFAALFLMLAAVRALGAIAASRRVEMFAASLLLAGGVFLFLARTVLPPIAAGRGAVSILAAAFALALTTAIVGRGLRASCSADDPIRRVLAAFCPPVGGRWDRLPGWLAIAGLVALAAATGSQTADWNFIVSDLGVALTWMLVFAAFVRFVDVPTFGRPLTLIAATGVVVGLNAGWTSAGFGATAEETGSLAVRSWTSFDPAARFLSERVRPPAAAADETLVDLLQRHTNVPATVHVEPVDVSFGPARRGAGYRPHIFLIVVDSLRRDYLGLYNSRVTFTPSLDAFGRENVAFDRAFTRYGATGLAIPSIWTGGMLLHKQYVTPFAPMNALARLLAHEDYAQWIGLDNIMEAILPPSERREPLDARRMVKDFRLCQTLGEIRSRLNRRRPGDPPVFAYTLPQDIHVSTLTREGRRAIDSGRYEGFDAAVASRVRALDRCFGEFVADLKARQLYDDSVVIVTSDHGDSLGEGGRMGHAYTLFPEIVQIPLLVHLPARLATGVEAENEGYVFSTDITPTLHALLGVPTRQPGPFFGRPLFRARGTAPRPPEPRPPVLAASYGAVYGALLDGGGALYVLDTINMREHAFRLDGSGPGVSQPLTGEVRLAAQAAVRATVEDIAQFYRFAPVR